MCESCTCVFREVGASLNLIFQLSWQKCKKLCLRIFFWKYIHVYKTHTNNPHIGLYFEYREFLHTLATLTLEKVRAVAAVRYHLFPCSNLFVFIIPKNSRVSFLQKVKSTDCHPLIVSRQGQGASSSWVRPLTGSLWVTGLPLPLIHPPYSPSHISCILTWTLLTLVSHFRSFMNVNVNAKEQLSMLGFEAGRCYYTATLFSLFNLSSI